MLALLALLTSAQGAEPGFFHPNEIAPQSQEYLRATGPASARYAERDEKAGRIAAALAELGESLDLLGTRAPADQVARYENLKKAFNREMAVLQAFASAMMDDFDGEFTAAMERALNGAGNPKECASRVPTSKPMPGMPVRMKDNPDCKGPNRNADVASAMDADPALQASISEILALEWPDITVPSEAQAAVGQGDRWVSVASFFRETMKSTLRAIDREDSKQRLDFEAAIEEGASVKDREALIAQARKVTANTAARRAAAAEPTLLAADKLSAKLDKQGSGAFAWCANPTAFGGCTGVDASGPLHDLLLDDKKVAKTLP